MRANRYIVLENVSKSYFSGGRRIDVLEKLSLTINKNEFISIVGPMGCGKTTLLNIINGITSPSSGRVLIDGKGGCWRSTKHGFNISGNRTFSLDDCVRERGLRAQDKEGQEERET
jgi:ABC-type lipoprotein export system ATPase subunit